MGFLDKAKELGAKGLDKAKDAGEIGKCKIKIAEAEGDIKGIFAKIGKALAEEHPDVLAEIFPEDAAKLAELNETIDGLKAQIASVKADDAE